MLRILVVDDEDLIRKGLIKILKKTGIDIEVIGEASNGIQALKMVEADTPDLVITDIKMPEMDGMELVKSLEMSHPKIKKIVLSGFDEFNFVRDTMKNGAFDYLLKPIDDVQLTEVLKKIENEMNDEKTRKLKELNLKVQFNESMPLLREQFISELILDNKYNEPEIRKKFEYYGINLPSGSYLAVIISIDNYKRLFEKLGAEDTKLKSFVLRNIVEETIAVNIEFVSCIINNDLVVVLSLQNEADAKVRDILNIVYDNVMKYAKLRFTISVGEPVQSLTELKESYSFAVNLLKYRFYNDNSGIITRNCINGFLKPKYNNEILMNYSEKFESKLKNCIELANTEPIKDTVEEFGSKLKEFEVGPHEAIKLLTDTYLKLQIEYSEFKKAVTEGLGSEFSYLKHIEAYDTLDEVKKYTQELYTGIIKQIVDIRKRKDKKLVEIVKEYIIKHYNEDITLNRIAEVVYVNSSYICDLFKTQTGENFVDYLTKIRIEKAKVLLRNVKIKTYEVGQMVGYEDATYFSKVFKKVVGVSPSEYRNIVE
jgi:two-component system, response regulator YesN